MYHDYILDYLERKENLDMIYLDFSKVFDRVNHSVHLSKLKALGIKGNFGSGLGTFLLGRTKKVKVRESLSQEEIIL